MTRHVPLRSRKSWRRKPKAKKAALAIRGGTFRQIKSARWARLCQQVRLRDRNLCRYCGASALAGPVDHILTRRLYKSDAPDGLAVLCLEHHGMKTAEVERDLFAGDIYKLLGWLKVIGKTGPIPDARMIGTALERLRKLLTNR